MQYAFKNVLQILLIRNESYGNVRLNMHMHDVYMYVYSHFAMSKFCRKNNAVELM